MTRDVTDQTRAPGERCRICLGTLHDFDTGVVLGTREVSYYRCSGCAAVVLPEPTWLDAAYSDAISALDVGLMSRCLRTARVTASIVRSEGLTRGRFLDWAGGYGVLTRLLRDDGLNFHHWDPYCPNLFAQGCEGGPTDRYDLVTAFEVLEHLTDPLASLADLATRTDRLLFSTFLVTDPPPPVGEWWYYAPESGQHVTFYSRRSLQALGERLGYRLTTNGTDLHLFHRGGLRPGTRLKMSRQFARLERGVYRAGQYLGSRRGRQSLLPLDASAAARCAQERRMHDSS